MLGFYAAITNGGVLWRASFAAYPPGVLATLPGGLSLSRASVASVQTSASQAVTGIAADTARMGATGAGPRGLVIEVARTNVVPSSRNPLGSGWSAGSLYKAGSPTRPYGLGPDGDATTATRHELTSGGYSQYCQPGSAAVGWYVHSLWVVQAVGGGSSNDQSTIGVNSTIVAALGGTAPAAWTRRVFAAQQNTGGLVTIVPQDARDWRSAGGINAGARDAVTDLHQMEVGRYATEAIVTPSGTTATRAADRLYLANDAGLLSGGRMGLHVRLYPKGGAALQDGVVRVATHSATTYVQFDPAIQQLTVVVNGTSWTPATTLNWNGAQLLDLWIEYGGGSLQSHAAYAVGGGSWTNLGSSGAAQGVIASGSLDFLCNGTANTFSSWLDLLEAYPAGQRPGGVP